MVTIKITLPLIVAINISVTLRSDLGKANLAQQTSQ